MEVKTSLFGDDSLSKLERIIFDYYYSLSSIAASKGKYSLASDYLSELLKSNGESARIFDLQAKIAAQQGKFKEAEFLWEKCIKTEPDNMKYIASLNRIHELQKSKFITHFNLFKFVAFILAVFLFLFIFIAVLYSIVENNSKIDNLQKQQFEILEQVNNNSRSDEILFEETLLSEIANKVEMLDGISINKKNVELVITFNDGLFSNGINFNVLQETYINKIAQVLEPYSGQILITILGCFDNTPVTDSTQFQSNNALGLARANFIYDIFYNNSRILPESLQIGSVSENNAPFSNNSRENRIKNRTVVIKITQK